MTNKKVIDIEAARSKRKPKKKIKFSEKSKGKKAGRSKEPLSPRQKKQRNRKIITFLVIVTVIGLTVGVSAYKMISLKVEKNRLQAEQEELKKEREALKNEAKSVQDLDYIEQQARKQLNLVLPGEILYVLPEIAEDAKEQ